MNNSLRRRRRTSEDVHCSLGSCGRCLFVRLVDGCLDQGLNFGQLALWQHSFVRRVTVQQVLDLLFQLLKLLLEFYVVAAILNRGWGANELYISPGFSCFFEPIDERGTCSRGRKAQLTTQSKEIFYKQTIQVEVSWDVDRFASRDTSCPLWRWH